MTAARAIVTADTPAWAEIAGRTMTGYATSVIACDAEAADRARRSAPDETPDGRPGVSVLVFAFSRDALEKALANRVGQCVMTCPTTACYNGLPVGEKTINVGGRLRYFGDGWQISKRLDGRRYWRIPVMDGEFTCEETFGTTKGVAGGNIILLGTDPPATLAATEAAVAAMRALPRRDPAVPRRDRPLGLEGRQQVQGAPRQHQHRLRPDPARPGRDSTLPAGGPVRLRDRHRRPDPGGGRARHGRRASAPGRRPGSSRITAGQLRRQARAVPHPAARRPGSMVNRIRTYASAYWMV